MSNEYKREQNLIIYMLMFRLITHDDARNQIWKLKLKHGMVV